MKRLRSFTPVVLIPFVFALSGCPTSTSGVPGAGTRVLPFNLSEWEYPAARGLGVGRGGDVLMHRYATADPIADVWAHYANLAGVDATFNPGDGEIKFDFQATIKLGSRENAVTNEQGEVIAYHMGDPDRTSVRSAYLVVQRPGYTAVVVMSRGHDDVETYLDLIADLRVPPAH